VSDKTERAVPFINIVVVYGVAAAMIVLPFLYAIDWKIGDIHPTRYHLTLDTRAFFVFLSLLPGFLAFVYHLVTVRQRRDQNRQHVTAFYAFKQTWHGARDFEKGVALTTDATRGPVSANAASALLTGVFLFVALFAGYNKGAGVEGMLYAGMGAYIAVLYTMVPRIYASALSSRFLMTSALRSASAVALGWVLMLAGGALVTESKVTTSVVFLSGVFHNWALDALRQRARKLFGQEEPESVEVSIAVIEGVDDTAADLLNEYGVTSVQHLATAEPGDLCERTLLPMDRVVDWIDQALLVAVLKRNIAGARAVCVRGAVELVAIYLDADGGPVLKTLAEKTNVSLETLTLTARDLSRHAMVRLIYKMRYGQEIPDAPQSMAGAVAATIAKDYDVVGLDANPIGRLAIKQQPQTTT
jgi:hypothetical protein